MTDQRDPSPGPGRHPFADRDDLGGYRTPNDPPGPVAGDPVEAILARYAASTDVRPADDLAARIGARLGREPRRSAPGRFLAGLAALDARRAATAWRQSVDLAFGRRRGGFVLRTQALALVLVSVLAVGGVGLAGAAGVLQVLRTDRPTPGPVPTQVVPPRPTETTPAPPPVPTPTPSLRPQQLPSEREGEGDETAQPRQTRRPTAEPTRRPDRETPKPRRTNRPERTETPEPRETPEHDEHDGEGGGDGGSEHTPEPEGGEDH
jgi:hypothetical protein